MTQAEIQSFRSMPQVIDRNQPRKKSRFLAGTCLGFGLGVVSTIGGLVFLDATAMGKAIRLEQARALMAESATVKVAQTAPTLVAPPVPVAIAAPVAPAPAPVAPSAPVAAPAPFLHAHDIVYGLRQREYGEVVLIGDTMSNEGPALLCNLPNTVADAIALQSAGQSIEEIAKSTGCTIYIGGNDGIVLDRLGGLTKASPDFIKLQHGWVAAASWGPIKRHN